MFSAKQSDADPPSKVAPSKTVPPFPSCASSAIIPKVQNNDAAFPIRLHEMIEWVEDNYPNSIRPIYWSKNGRSFVIQDHESLGEHILPHFFKRIKVESFTRKLNRWGFRLTKHGPHKGAYMHRDFFRWDLPLSMTSMCRDSKRNRKSNDDSVTDGRNYEQVAKEQRHDKKSRKMPPGERALSAVVSKNSNYALQFNYERPGSSDTPSDTPSHCPNLSIVGGHASQQYLAGNNFSLFPPNPQTNANLFKLPLNQNLEPSFQPLQTLPVNNMPGQTRQLDSAVINMSEMMGGDLNMSDDPNDMVINGWNNFPSNRIKKAHNMMTNATAQGFGTSFDCSTSKPSISDALAPNPDRDINLGPVDFRHSRTATSNRTYTEKNTIYTEDELSPLAVFAHKPNQGINIDEVKGICPWTFTSNRKYKENSTTGFYSEDSLSPLAASVPNTDRDIDQGKGRYPGIAASKRACMVHNKNGFYSGDALSPLAVFAPNTNRDVSQGQGEVFGHSSVRNINQGHADPISFRSTTMGNRAEKENYDEIEEANEEEMDRDLSAFFARLEKSIWKNEYKSRHDIK